MAVNPTYPGVYIDEVPSAVRTIIGVPTAVAAFVGPAVRGPIDRARHITSWADFERIYGGLSDDSLMTYAVFQYYQNGGSEAEIVRVAAANATATLDLGKKVVLRAKDTGSGGNGLVARVDADPADATLYKLSLHPKSGADEVIDGIKKGVRAPDAASLESKLAGARLVRLASQGDDDPDASPAPAGGAGPFDDPALHKSEGGRDGADPSTLRLIVNPKGDKNNPDNYVTLTAASPGAWGKQLRARVDYDTRDPADDKLYNLTVRDAATGAQETFRNVAAGGLGRSLRTSDLVAAGSGAGRPAESPVVDPGVDPFADPDTGATATYVAAEGGDDGQTIVGGDIQGDDGASRTGIYLLRDTDIFTILCIPPIDRSAALDSGLMTAAATLCLDRRAMLLVDSPPPDVWKDAQAAVDGFGDLQPKGDPSRNAALYFPWLRLPDRDGQLLDFPPCGVIAGVWARIDGQRNVAKAPAGLEASLNGVAELTARLTDLENGRLNPLGVNCLRTFPVVGSVAWGARTLQGADRLASQWKYVPVRRTALYIEESLYRGTQWVVFEPNDEPLWSAIRLNVGAFMNSLFRQGMFQGRTPQEAYLVKCDRENNPQNDIDRGIVNILVGFAPLKPAEFVLIHIQQLSPALQV
jgi:phage tail sheath protein FI